MEPSILLNVPVTSEVYTEEVFELVVVVDTFVNKADALAEANGTEFGLIGKLLSWSPWLPLT
jgi:acyl-CoA reductase-like NAD-dependent aldehyde dehydrogenase